MIVNPDKAAALLAATLCAALALPGCAPALFARAQPEAGAVSAVILEHTPSFGDTAQLRTQALVFTQDGVMTRLELTWDVQLADATEDDLLSSETRQAQPGAFEQVAQAAEGFAALPDTIDTGVLDGDYEYITVQAGADSWRKGGLVASREGPAQFKRLYKAVRGAWEAASPLEEPSSSPAPPVTPGEWALGNTPGNLASGIDALAYEGEVFVTLYEGVNGRPVRLAEDGTARPAPWPGAEQVLDGWLYYRAYGPGGASIRRVRPQGGEPETLLAGRPVVAWQVAGGYLYVLEDESPPGVESYIPVQGLWRRPIEGGAEQRCAPGNVAAFALAEQALFASMQDGLGFVCARLDGGGETWLDVAPRGFFWQEGWLYYSTEQDGWGRLWRVTGDGGAPELLVEQADGGFNLEGDWLYYNRRLEPANRDHWFPNSVLERKHLQTGEVQLLDGEGRLRRGVALAGDWVVFGTAVLDETHGVPWGETLWCIPKTGGQAKEITG